MQVGVYFSTENYRVRVRDCDDTKPELTTNCEKKLSPCFGTTVDGLMPDGNGDQSEFVGQLETIMNSFFAQSDVFETLEKTGILKAEDLSKGFKGYIKGGKAVGLLSIGFTVNDYLNDPTTENLMEVFVEGAITLLPPPASIGYTVGDTIYQKYHDGQSISEYLAQKISEFIEEVFNCDLGAGVYGLFK
jgi:hypothetical protein